MNKILYFKVRKNLKSKNEQKIKEIVEKLQKDFNIQENSDIFDIENKINDKDYSEYIKEK